MTKKTWEEFRESKMLWWVNRIIHTFGWAIVVELDSDGTITDAYPARVKFRGFPEEVEEAGFAGISRHLRDNAIELEVEANS